MVSVWFNRDVCQDGAHLTPGISEGHGTRRLGIILQLEFVPRFFDCIQLILGVNSEASLPDFE
jgi:hypothetical protein